MARFTGSIYYSMSPDKLRKLRSKKVLELNRLGEPKGLFQTKDYDRLKQQIAWIDAALNWRDQQMSFPE